MRNILVTGSNGMLGQQVVDALIHEGYYVTGISIEKCSKFKHAKFTYISTDLTRSAEVERIFMDNEFSHVIHLAAIAHVLKGMNISWSRYYRVNTIMSRQIFECASVADIPIFFSSSVDVYGIANEVIDENTEPKPVGAYAKSKYLAEMGLIEVAKQPYLIARFAPIYTEKDRRDIYRRYYISFPKLCYLIGDGMEYEFLSSKNAVNLILMWVKSPVAFGGILNVCDAKRHNTRELIKIDKKNEMAHRVIRISKVIREVIRIFVNIVFFKNAFLKFTSYKIISPIRLKHKKFNSILQNKDY